MLKKLLFLIPIFASLGLSAQQTLEYSDPVLWYNRGLELYDKEKYAAAIPEFEEYLETGEEYELKINARFYLSFCHLELDHKSAEQEVLNLLDEHPDHPKANYAYFLLGRYYNSRNNLGKSMDYLEQCRPQHLEPDDRKAYRFMYGYALFTREKYEEAKTQLRAIENNKDKYYYPSNYYLGYMAMVSGEDEVALAYFRKLQKSKVYGELSTVYIVKMYYRLGQYENLIAYSDTLGSVADKAEILWERGKAWFQMGKYQEAVNHLERGREGRTLESADQYILGLAYYHIQDYENAHVYLTAIHSDQDPLKQSALFYAGDCFLQLDKKTNARNAFYEASRLSTDGRLQEMAWFQYAKLTMEPPFQNEAVRVLKEFIEAYPNSQYSDEAKGYLGDALLTAKRYSDAIPVIESIKNKTQPIKKTYQQICYYYANELIRQDPEAAKQYYTKARVYPIDEKLDAQVDFWMGEILYNEGKTEEAEKSWERFISNPSSKETPVYNDGLYNLGYAYFDSKEYGKASVQFKQYTRLESYSGERKNKYIDGMTRLGDCYYIGKSYTAAVEAYSYVTSKSAPNSDYALYQIGMIRGHEGKLEEKMVTMKRIPAQHPNSEYVDDALYQIALVDLQRQNYEEAYRGFSFLLEEYPNGIYAKESHLKRGLTLINLKRTDEALADYKFVVENYPKGVETEEAIKRITEILTEAGRGKELVDYLEGPAKKTLAVSYVDSTLYFSAQKHYENRNCSKAITDFGDYLQRFPNGHFVTRAQFFRSECLFAENKYEEALPGYEMTIARNYAEFMERALRRAAAILIWKQLPDGAVPYLRELEKVATQKENILYAQSNLMYAYRELNRDDLAEEYASKVLDNEKAQNLEKHDARLILGRILIDKGELDKARTYLEKVEKAKENKNARGAEAAYYLCQITYKKGELGKVEGQVYKLDEKYANQVYWVARAYYLLGQALMDQKDFANARAVLNSIVDNYPVADDGVLDEGRKLLDRLNELESAASPNPGK